MPKIDMLLHYESTENVSFGFNRNMGHRAWISAAQFVKRSSRINTFDANRYSFAHAQFYFNAILVQLFPIPLWLLLAVLFAPHFLFVVFVSKTAPYLVCIEILWKS